MRTEFDPLRTAPLPDSFDRTADWLRAAPPPRPSPTRLALVVAALVVLVGACSVPVETEAVVGYAVEAVTDDAGALLHALDAAVPAGQRVSAEVGPVEGGAEVVRYLVLDADAADAAEAAARGRGGSVRVTPVGAAVRQPLGLAAARWLGVTANPRLSDADLQAALDRAFAGHPTAAPRLERAADGRRALALGEHVRVDGLDPGTRVARAGSTIVLSGGDLRGFSVGDVPIGRVAGVAALDSSAFASLLDSLGAGRGEVRGTFTLSGEGLLRRLDSLGVSPEMLGFPGGRIDSARGLFVRVPDSTDTP